MFVFSLTLNDIKGKKTKLPPLQNWLNPNFAGVGDMLFSKETNTNNINDPRNFKKDFPDYVYQYDELIILKNKLNKEKSALDAISNTPEHMQRFSKITNCARSYDLLRGKNGLLCQNYNAEIVTNAWLKMFENMIFLDEYLEKIHKSKDKQFNSIHLAEAPGNFILAINHYLKTNYPRIEWNWMANSYRDIYQSNINQDTKYLGDTYGLIKKYNNNWFFGADCDGDITSPANIVSLKQEVIKRFKDNVHFITSDVKYVPEAINYDEEENYNIPVHLGHLLCVLNTLSSGGIMILKEFTFFESASVSLLYLMANCFNKLLIVKPETSKPANSEVYIVGIEYRDNITKLQMERLLSIMNYIRYLNNANGSPAIFRKDDIPLSFVNKVVEFSQKLVDIQIPSIKKNIEHYYKYEDESLNKICEEFANINEKLAQNWIKRNQIKKLNTGDQMIEKKEFRRRY